MQELSYFKETPSQTAGPYVHIGLAPAAAGFDIFEQNFGPDPASSDASGEQISVEGMVYDGMGTPIKDVLIEVWQADASGTYQAQPSDGFTGWGRIVSDFETGLWSFNTIKPGTVPGRSGHKPMAPHISFWIVARGINIGLNTRMYFDDQTDANATDPVLNLIEHEHRRQTLIAQKSMRNGKPVYRFDIRVQGDGETVFLDI